MTTIVIFDDDAHSIAHIRSLVEQCMPADISFSIHGAQTLDQLTALLSQGIHIDILLSDIAMPEGQPSGIEVVQRLFPAESGTQVIYVSGFLHQATEVYRTAHIYFLLKPIEPEKLREALARACTALTSRRPAMLRVKSGHREHLIDIASISYLESHAHKISVHCRSGIVETYAKLGDLQERLPQSFTRCHGSYLVNLAYVSALNEAGLRLHDGTVIPVSRRRTHQVQHDLLTYLSQ